MLDYEYTDILEHSLNKARYIKRNHLMCRRLNSGIENLHILQFLTVQSLCAWIVSFISAVDVSLSITGDFFISLTSGVVAATM